MYLLIHRMIERLCIFYKKYRNKKNFDKWNIKKEMVGGIQVQWVYLQA